MRKNPHPQKPATATLQKPHTAFLLAAGKGTRLRPHTDTMPKPMVSVGGESIIRRALRKLAAEQIAQTVINLHHLAPVLAEHLQGWREPPVTFSYEDKLLETGGGAKKALPLIGNDPFYMINGDALWEDLPQNTGTNTSTESHSALSELARHWDAAKMDILLLLQPVNGMSLTHGVGDYRLLPDGRATRALHKDGDMMFAGIRIVHPRVFDEAPEGAFSFLSLMDRAEQQGRLYAIAHKGAWHHISTPEELARVDQHYRENGL